MDVNYPTIREIPVIHTNFGHQFSLSGLPSVLTPNSNEGFRDVRGHYRRVMPGTYVYHFDYRTSASKTPMRDFRGLEIRKAEVLDVEVPKTFPEFYPPMDFIPKFVLDKYLLSAKDLIKNMSLINTEAIERLLNASSEVIQRSTILKGDAVIRNEFLINWLNMHYSDFVIRGTEYLDKSSVTFHQSSKPDFCLFTPKHKRDVISAAAIDSKDEQDELYGLAGECKDSAYARPQSIANMVAVAGFLAKDALLQGRKFHKITVYGLECKHSTNEAIAREMTLDFEKNTSLLVEYQQREEIQKQIAGVATALRETQQ